jgi:hypothetical protein
MTTMRRMAGRIIADDVREAKITTVSADRSREVHPPPFGRFSPLLGNPA